MDTAASATPKKVLIIEDDESIRDILAAKLTDSGFRVIIAPTGQDGLALALQEHPDLILLDVLLPDTGGLGILDNLREDEWGKHAPVFVLTNLNANNTIYESVKLKAEAYFIKSDTSLEQIADEVKKKLLPSE